MPARAVGMMPLVKKIYILIIKINERLSFICSVCFLGGGRRCSVSYIKTEESIVSVLLSNYKNTRD